MIDVKKIAEQAGFVTSDVFGVLASGVPVNEQLEAFAALVLEAAAVECEKVSLDAVTTWKLAYQPQDQGREMGADDCAAAIRAMKPGKEQG